MNTKKIIVGLLAGVICFGMLSGVTHLRAQTLADTIARLPTDSSDWSKAFNDQSTYPNQDMRRGTVVRYYDVQLQTADLSESGVVVNVGTALPQGTLITGAQIHWLDEFLPITTTNELDIGITSDPNGILAGYEVDDAVAEAFQIGLPVPQTVATWELADNATTYVTVEINADSAPGAYTTPTQGIFMVFMDVLYTNPSE